jgi:hypothetical protein
MSRPEEVCIAFPEATFRAPATSEEVAEAERLLGHLLPPQLRELYLEFNGFQGPTNAPFLFPLLERPGPRGKSLVTYTLFFRGEDYFPEWVQRAIALGDNGTGTAWFMLVDEGDRLVRWDAEWEEYETVEGSLLDAWVREKALYESFRPGA